MKIKLIMGFIVASTVLMSCGEDPIEEIDPDVEMNDFMNQEADSIELLNESMDRTKMEIEESSHKVDELLNEL